LDVAGLTSGTQLNSPLETPPVPAVSPSEVIWSIGTVLEPAENIQRRAAEYAEHARRTTTAL